MTNPQPESEKNKLITILKTGNQAKIAVAKSILDSANIRYYVKSEIVQNLFGMGGIGGGNQITGPMELQVESDRLEEAKELLSELIEDSDKE